jgi:RsiW-degrading membrane proteinase PrsW (M82 family)
MEKANLAYIYPLPVIAIFSMYITEKKQPLSFLYTLSLAIIIIGGILLLLGLREYVSEVSILFSFFYIFFMRLMYLKNRRQKKYRVLYFRLVLIVLPIVYIYDRVMCLVYKEIRDTFVYLSVLIILALVYIILSLYYYSRNKNQANLWMLITSCNLGFMNIIIMINELYVSETIFTVISLFCYSMMLYFSLKFMLEDTNEDVLNVV